MEAPQETTSTTNPGTDDDEEEEAEDDHVPEETQNHLPEDSCDHPFEGGGLVINPYQFHVTFDIMRSACVRCSVCLAVAENVLNFAAVLRHMR